MKYPVVLHTDNSVSYSVTVPDIPGCFSAGDTMDDALECIKEAITGHIQILVEDGLPVPASKMIQTHQSKPDYQDGVWAVVDVDITPFLGKSEKINITLPRLLIHQIDQYVETHKGVKSRSGFLAHIAKRELHLN